MNKKQRIQTGTLRTICLNLPTLTVDAIDAKVDQGIVVNRTEFIRQAIALYLHDLK
jgi:Arc/MetJ-type ribon-helix-helix transcriptional regulator